MSQTIRGLVRLLKVGFVKSYIVKGDTFETYIILVLNFGLLKFGF